MSTDSQTARDAHIVKAGVGRPPKKLIYWFIGLFSAMSIVLIFLNHASKPANSQEEKQKKIEKHDNAKIAETAPQQPAVLAAIDKQIKSAELSPPVAPPPPSQLPPLPTRPGAATSGTNEIRPDTAEDQQEREARRVRDGQISTSRILAIEEGPKPVPLQKPANPFEALGLPAPAVGMDPRALEANVLETIKAASGGGQGKAAPARAESGPAAHMDRTSSWYKSVQAESAAGEGQPALKPHGMINDRTIPQGTSIPAVTLTRVDAALPGDIVAMVTRDVYDGMYSSNLLIPKGSRLFGKYASDVNFFQEKLPTAFTRLLLPNGVSIYLGGMPASDAAGGAGMSGEVDNHFLRTMSTSFLIAGIAYLAEKGTPASAGNNGTGTSGARTAAGQILVDTAKSWDARTNPGGPTFTVKQGTAFSVLVQRDMVLPIYEGKRR